MRRLTVSVGLAMLAVSAGCGRSRSAQTPAGGGQASNVPTHSVSAPFEIRGVMQKVQSMFRDDGAGFAAARTSYSAQVSPAGETAFTPRIVEATQEADAALGQGGAPVVTARSFREGAPARITTLEIRRGSAPAAAADAPLRAPDGSLLIPHGDVVERLESTERGLEQSWTFPGRPQGTGDLTVRVAVAGLSPAGVTAGGLHFQDAASGVGVRYGTATWVDGVGRATEVPARLDAGDVVLTVPEELVERSAYPAVLDPVISAELALDDDVTVYASYNAVVASNGIDFLLAWSDLPSGSTGAHIVAARVNAQGAVLDPAGIVLTPAGIRYWGSVGAAGNPTTGTYLVTWLELRDGAPILPGNGAYVTDLFTHGAFVTPDGRTTTAVAGAWPNVSGPSRPAPSGTGFVLAGAGLSSYSQLGVSVYRVDDVGGALGWTPQGWFPMAGNALWTPGVACKPSGDCLVSWVQLQNGVYTPSVGWSGGTMVVYGAGWPAGGVVGQQVTLALSGAADPSLVARPAVVAAGDGAPFFVMWPAMDATSIPRLYGLLVDAVPGDPTSVAPTIAAPTVLTGDAARPRIASGTFDGRNFVVVEADRRFGTRATAYGFRVDPATAALLPPGELMLSNPSEGAFASPAWAAASGVGLVQWTPLTSSMVTTRFWDDPTAGLLIDRPGGVPINVVVGHSETSPKADFDGTGYFVTWIDDRAGSQVLGARVSQAGAVLDASPVLLVPLATVQSHALAFNGENHVLAWVNSSDHTIYLSRLTPALALLDLGVPVGTLDPGMTESGNVRIVASGRDLLVLWPVYDGTTGARRLYARRMSGDGVALDPSPVIVAGNVSTFSVASSGAGWFVVYSVPGASAVRGILVGADGTRGVDAPLADTASFQAYPGVVFDGARYRAVWRDNRSDPNGQLYSARFEVDGTRTPGPDVQLTSVPEAHNQTGVVFDGQNTLLLWQDAPAGATGNLIGAWVTSAGTVVDPETAVAAGVVTWQRGAASNGAGTVLVAYTTNDPVTQRSRVVARLVTEGASLVVSRSGSGAGRVTSAPAGIDCGTSCTTAFAAGTPVTLTAQADAGSVFTGWSGACTGSGACAVTAGAVTQVSAKFDLAAATGSFPLTISYAGTGTGVAVPDLALGTYPVGTVVHVSATASPDSRFTAWSGACRGTAQICTLVVGGPVDLTAIFDRGAPQPFNLPPPQLLPGAGPISGGTTVTLSGSGFLPGASVAFGGNAAPSVSVAPDGYSMVVTTPPGVSAGPVDVVIAVPGGQVTTVPAGFTYFDTSSNSPAGQDVTVVPAQPANAPTVQMHFDEIQAAGQTTITPLASAPAVPTDFFVVSAPSQPKFLEVQTAASYRGKIELTITYDPVAMGLTGAQERALRLIHFDGTRWEDATEVANPHTPPYGDADPHFFGRNSPPFVNPDTRTHTLYGVVTSFSPIALAVGGASAGVDLLVTAYGPGSGRIQGPGIDCASGAGACSASFSLDGGAQTVDLVAVPDPGSMLWSWGGPCSGTGPCRVTMSTSRWVVAAFKPDSNVLTVAAIGGGSGTVTSAPAGISCRPGAATGCTLRIADTAAATLTLTAQPDPGFVFKGWSAPCLGSTALQCTVDVHAGVLVTATFAPATLPVVLKPLGDGNGTLSGGGVSCSVAQRQCELDVPNTPIPTVVTFQANPASDSLFLGWGGMCSGSGATCTLSMQGWGEVQAYFTPRTYPLAVTFQGSGAGHVEGGTISCDAGGGGTCRADVANTQPPATVTLTPTPAPGSTFTGWAGACGGTGPCVVTMGGARTAIAQFDRAP